LWSSDYTEYQPPYFVAPSVLDNDRTQKKGGWAGPEQFHPVKEVITSHEDSVTFDKMDYR
jgi:ADP-ribose pyrophosphatase